MRRPSQGADILLGVRASSAALSATPAGAVRETIFRDSIAVTAPPLPHQQQHQQQPQPHQQQLGRPLSAEEHVFPQRPTSLLLFEPGHRYSGFGSDGGGGSRPLSVVSRGDAASLVDDEEEVEVEVGASADPAAYAFATAHTPPASPGPESTPPRRSADRMTLRTTMYEDAVADDDDDEYPAAYDSTMTRVVALLAEEDAAEHEGGGLRSLVLSPDSGYSYFVDVDDGPADSVLEGPDTILVGVASVVARCC
jgi:hypothetical protein